MRSRRITLAVLLVTVAVVSGVHVFPASGQTSGNAAIQIQIDRIKVALAEIERLVGTTLIVPTTATTATTTTTATTATTVPAPVMPTAANTGPVAEPTATVPSSQAIAARGVSNKVITGDVRIEDYGGTTLGTKWTFADCVIKGDFYFAVDNTAADYALGSYPTVSITRCRIEGSLVFIGAAEVQIDDTYVMQGAGMIAPCPGCAGMAQYGLVREMPWEVTNSLFRSRPGNPQNGDHVEAMHIAGAGQGYSFTNTRFVQEGPVNGTQTGAVFVHAGRTTFDGCWFDDGELGVSNSYNYAIYLYGTGPGARQNVVKNSAIEKGLSSYVYPDTPPDPVVHATYVNNRDFHTGAALTLP